MAQAAERIQDGRSVFRSINSDILSSGILSSDILPGILQNCTSVKQAIGNGQDRMKTDGNIPISCNDVSESECKSEISV